MDLESNSLFYWISVLNGGFLIGLSVTFMMFVLGRVTGISGIISEIISPLWNSNWISNKLNKNNNNSKKLNLKNYFNDNQWRLSFLAGLFCGGLLLYLIMGDAMSPPIEKYFIAVPIAGLLVGFGTAMGSGCTSGHGVCGISRLSKRSIIATLCFMLSGFISVYFFKSLGLYLK